MEKKLWRPDPTDPERSSYQTSLNKYSDLYNFAPVGYFTFNQDGLVLDVNLTGADQLGASRHQLIGRSFYSYLAPEDRGSFQTHLSSLFEEKARQSCTIKIERERGSFDARLESIPVVEAGGLEICRTCLIDVTERRRQGKGLSSESGLYRRGKQLHDRQNADYRRQAEEKLSRKKGGPPKTTSRKEMEALVHELALHQIELEMQNEDLRASQAALEASRESYSELYDFAPVGYFSFNENGVILNANLTGARQLGMERRGLIGMPFMMYVAEENVRPFLTHVNAVFKSKGRHRVQLKIKRAVREGKHQTIVPFHAELESVYFEAGEGERGCRTVLSDIAERKEAEDQIQKISKAAQQKNIALQEVNRARSRFFSFISHELKIPLNSVLGFAQLLSNGSYGALNPKQKKAVTRLTTNAGEMVHLINNILDISRIETGKMPTHRIETDLPELLKKISLSFEPLLKEKELDFKIKISPGTPKRFSTDPEQLRSVITNLLSNAVKFTTKGKIRLIAAPLSGNRGIRLTVSDTGIGIRPEDLARIFEEFEQSGFVRENPIRYTSGSGLGLSIVQKMVSLLGGTVQVESIFGKGSTFTVELFEDSLFEGSPKEEKA